MEVKAEESLRQQQNWQELHWELPLLAMKCFPKARTSPVKPILEGKDGLRR